MNRLVTWIVLIVIVVGAWYLLSQKPASPPAPTAPTQSSNTVTIQNFAFSPATLTIKPGTTVTWINQDTVTHNIKSASFNSPELSQGASYQFKFDNPGTYSYSCGIHPSMTGTIKVE